MIIRYGYDFNNCIYYALLDDNSLYTAPTLRDIVNTLGVDLNTLRKEGSRADILKF